MELYTDACDTGYGAVLGRAWFRGEWTEAQLALAKREERISMPFLELYALVLAALTWGEQWAGKRITFRTDSESAYYALHSLSSRTRQMAALIRVLTINAARCGYEFRCVHIPGKYNLAADALSRGGTLLTDFRAQYPTAFHTEATPIAVMPNLSS